MLSQDAEVISLYGFSPPCIILSRPQPWQKSWYKKPAASNTSPPFRNTQRWIELLDQQEVFRQRRRVAMLRVMQDGAVCGVQAVTHLVDGQVTRRIEEYRDLRSTNRNTRLLDSRCD